jgi:hypothetical protein
MGIHDICLSPFSKSFYVLLKKQICQIPLSKLTSARKIEISESSDWVFWINLFDLINNPELKALSNKKSLDSLKLSQDGKMLCTNLFNKIIIYDIPKY